MLGTPASCPAWCESNTYWTYLCQPLSPTGGWRGPGSPARPCPSHMHTGWCSLCPVTGSHTQAGRHINPLPRLASPIRGPLSSLSCLQPTQPSGSSHFPACLLPLQETSDPRFSQALALGCSFPSLYHPRAQGCWAQSHLHPHLASSLSLGSCSRLFVFAQHGYQEVWVGLF